MKKKPSPKTKKTRGPLRADEILSAMALARNGCDMLAAKYLILNADDETYADINRVFLALFNAVGTRSRLTGSR